MDAKMFILAILLVSLLFFGCAKKGGEAQGNATGASGSELAGLFNIDKDKPISDEGLNINPPHSNPGN